MRLTELFGARVLDCDGVVVGEVHDVRLAREPLGRLGDRLRIDGLVVGLGSVGSRLGYGHGQTRGPWILRAFFARVARSAIFVQWTDVVTRTPHELRLGVPRDRLEPLDRR